MSWMYYSKGRIRDRIIEHNSDISGELANQYLEQYGLFLTREVVESISI